MKRNYSVSSDIDMDTQHQNEYQIARKRVQLVERNAEPSGYSLLNAHNVGKHDANDIVQLARQIQTADDSIKHMATGKLTLILDQIKFLQSQAKQILEDTETNKRIHQAACNFIKVPGTVYHLYKRPSGQNYISMLSPQEWSDSLAHEFLGSFRLEGDLSWTPADRIAVITKSNAWAHKLLDSSADCDSNMSKFLAIE